MKIVNIKKKNSLKFFINLGSNDSPLSFVKYSEKPVTMKYKEML